MINVIKTTVLFIAVMLTPAAFADCFTNQKVIFLDCIPTEGTANVEIQNGRHASLRVGLRVSLDEPPMSVGMSAGGYGTLRDVPADSRIHVWQNQGAGLQWLFAAELQGGRMKEVYGCDRASRYHFLDCIPADGTPVDVEVVNRIGEVLGIDVRHNGEVVSTTFIMGHDVGLIEGVTAEMRVTVYEVRGYKKTVQQVLNQETGETEEIVREKFRGNPIFRGNPDLVKKER